MLRPHVQVILGADTIPDTLEPALRRAKVSASFRPLADALGGGLTPTADAVIVIAPEDTRTIASGLRILLDRMADRPRAVLVMKADGRYMPRLNHPPTVPVTFACALGEDELATRIATMVEMRVSLDTLHRAMLTNQETEAAAARRYQNQLRLASQVQREFLPDTNARFGPVSFQTLYRPADFVSGDIYDIQRLDEDHVGIALADATGHGIPAALLTVFIKRALRGKEIHDGTYRILRPDEVLRRLNDDILDANLTECRFVAAIYAVLNIRTLELQVARGGSPYPLLRRADGVVCTIRPGGGVVGVLPEASFAVETVQLQRGDAVLLYSDGLDAMVIPPVPALAVAEAFARVADVVRSGRADPSESDAEVAFMAAARAVEGSGFCGEAGASEVGSPRPGPLAVNGARASASASPGVIGAVPRTSRLSWSSTAGGSAEQPPFERAQRREDDRCPATARPWSAPAGPCLKITDGTETRCATCAKPLPDEEITHSPWYETLQRSGVAAALDELGVRHDMLRRIGHPLDDVTAVALQIDPP